MGTRKVGWRGGSKGVKSGFWLTYSDIPDMLCKFGYALSKCSRSEQTTEGVEGKATDVKGLTRTRQAASYDELHWKAGHPHM